VVLRALQGGCSDHDIDDIGIDCGGNGNSGAGAGGFGGWFGWVFEYGC
jgi:hypothetical protein